MLELCWGEKVDEKNLSSTVFPFLMTTGRYPWIFKGSALLITDLLDKHFKASFFFQGETASVRQ